MSIAADVKTPSSRRSALESLPTAVVALVFACLSPGEWVRLRRASSSLGTASELAAAGPSTLDFYDREAAAREAVDLAMRRPLAQKIHGIYVSLSEHHRRLAPLPATALRMSPRCVTMETDPARLLQATNSVAWRDSVRSLTLVLPVGQQRQLLGPLQDLQKRLTALVLLTPPDAIRDANAIIHTVSSLPVLSHVARFECAGLVPSGDALANLSHAFPALRQLDGLRHDRWADVPDDDRWADLPDLTRVSYVSVHHEATRHFLLGQPLALPPTVREIDVRVVSETEIAAIGYKASHHVAIESPYALMHLGHFSSLVRLAVRADRMTLDPCELLCKLSALRDLTVYARHLVARELLAAPRSTATTTTTTTTLPTKISRVQRLVLSVAGNSAILLPPLELPHLRHIRLSAGKPCDVATLAIPLAADFALQIAGVTVTQSPTPWPGRCAVAVSRRAASPVGLLLP
jgi:hypothetical protein